MAGSVTQLLDMFSAESPALRNEAAEEIWLRYRGRLLSLVRHRLSARIRRREDEDDICQEMYLSFCSGQERGEFDLHDREGLWSLLLMLTGRKVIDAIRRETAAKRHYSREQPLLAGGSDFDNGTEADLVTSSEPCSTEEAVFTEKVEQLLRILGSPDLRRIACMKLFGYTNKEVAIEFGCTERTVERKLARIRKQWRGYEHGF